MKIKYYYKIKNNMIKLNLTNIKQNAIYYKIKLNNFSNNHFYYKRRKKNYRFTKERKEIILRKLIIKKYNRIFIK